MVDLLDLSETEYFTKRSLQNENGEKTGHLVMFKKKGNPKHHVIMTCPYCLNKQETDEEFEKKPYRVKCSKCEKSIVVVSLKDSVKKKKGKKKED